MKKLIILMLVLGMATVANATLTEDLSWSGNATAATVDIDGTSTVVGEMLVSYIAYTNTLSSITLVYTGAGSGIADAIGAAGFLEGKLGITSGSITALKQITIGDSGFTIWANGQLVTSSTTGAGDVYLTDATGDVLFDSIHIPEPMTMALLGLGGLFIRRKK